MIATAAVLVAAALGALPGAVAFRKRHGSQEAPTPAPADKVKVELLFIRHGHACHNLLNGKYQGSTTFAKIIHCRYPDPPLTDCGLRSSQENGKELRRRLETAWGWTPHFLGASSMLRAMETAHAMFPDTRVHSMPFISELGGGAISPCNEPGDVAQQSRALNNDTLFKFGLVSWDNHLVLQDTRVKRAADHFFSHGHKTKWTSKEARSAVLYKEFRAFLGEQVVKKLVESPEDVGYTMRHGTKVVKIAIVSHSGFLRTKIKKYFKCDGFFNKVYFQNNAAMLVYYDYDPTTHMLREGTSNMGLTCQLPLQRKDFRGDMKGMSPGCGWSEKYACARDYQRCYANQGWKYMGHKVAPAAGSPSSYVRPQPPEGSKATCCLSQMCPNNVPTPPPTHEDDEEGSDEEEQAEELEDLEGTEDDHEDDV